MVPARKHAERNGYDGILETICEKYDCTIANLALGWILAQGDFLNLLSGSTTVDEIRENVKSAELELDPEDVAFMRESAEAIDK